MERAHSRFAEQFQHMMCLPLCYNFALLDLSCAATCLHQGSGASEAPAKDANECVNQLLASAPV